MYYDQANDQWFTKSTLTVEVEDEDSDDNSDSNEYYSESPPMSEDVDDATMNPPNESSSHFG